MLFTAMRMLLMKEILQLQLVKLVNLVSLCKIDHYQLVTNCGGVDLLGENHHDTVAVAVCVFYSLKLLYPTTQQTTQVQTV